jgi:hypothetical protein
MVFLLMTTVCYTEAILQHKLYNFCLAGQVFYYICSYIFKLYCVLCRVVNMFTTVSHIFNWLHIYLKSDHQITAFMCFKQ